MNILVVGGVSYNTMVYLDALPHPVPQTILAKGYHETIGSTGAGKALNLKRLGFEVSLHALVGDDGNGKQVGRILAENEVHTLLETDPAGTKRHLNLMSPDGARVSIFLEGGSQLFEVNMAMFGQLLQQTDLVVLNILNYARRLIPAIVASGKPVWCDIHDYDGKDAYHRDFIDCADVVQLSSDALPAWRPYMAALPAQGKSWVICTHGRHGATGLDSDGRWIEMPALHGYAIVDTNGAGDAFFAGVLYGKSCGLDLEHALRLGAVAGGLCITSHELAHPDLSVELVRREYQRHFQEPLPF